MRLWFTPRLWAIMVMVLGTVFLFQRSEDGQLGSNGSIQEESHTVSRTDASPAAPLVKASLVSTPIEPLRAAVEVLRQASDLQGIIDAKFVVETLFRTRPELQREVPWILSSANLPRRQALALIHSLGVVGGLIAEDTLVSLASTPTYEPGYRLQAIVTIGELDRPSNETLNALWEMARISSTTPAEISNAALLNLGVVLSHLPLSEEEMSVRALEELQQQLSIAREARNPRERTILDAIGNTGSREVLMIVQPYLESQAADERSLGAFTLRRVEGEDVDSRLLSIAGNDDEASVRRAALDALQNRPGSKNTVDKIGELLFDETDAAVRGDMIRYLGPRMERFPGISSVLRDLLPRESNSDNYDLAIQLLHSGPFPTSKS